MVKKPQETQALCKELGHFKPSPLTPGPVPLSPGSTAFSLVVVVGGIYSDLG